MSVSVNDRLVTSGRRAARRIAAILVTVLATLGLGVGAGLPAQAVATGSITGTVTGPDGAPVAGVSVRASGSSYWPATTAADGTYAITGLPADSYLVSFEPPSGAYLAAEYWHGAATWEEATVVTLTDGAASPGIDAQLAVAGTISGTVTGPDGDPVNGGSVLVTAAPVGTGRGSLVSTASDGTYTIDGLVAGSYTVIFEAGREWETRYAPEYWNDAASASTATPVAVAGGATTAGISAQLEVPAGVSGRATTASGAGADVKVEVLDGAGVVMPGGTSFTFVDGTFSMTGLRAGDVRVAFARASGTTQYVPQYFDGAATLAAASTVSLTGGATTTGIDATLATGASITGRVLAADGSPRAGLEMRALSLDGSLPTRGGVTDEDGQYVIQGLLPGNYLVASVWSSPDYGDTFYGTGEVAPSAPNVTVTGTATTRGIDIVTGVSEQPLFLDVLPGASFFADIQWLAGRGITRGSVQSDGSVFFDPAGPVRREAMAAFLYRFAGSPAFTPPATSPFVDVATSDTFYKEIAWLAGQGISTGTPMGDGTFQFRPAESVSREAMAAFLYRFKGKPAFTPPVTSPFVDVAPGGSFYKEISWLAANHISTGTDLGDGTFAFRPTESVSREAMAAFLHRTNSLVP